jgi:hypothetical protein
LDKIFHIRLTRGDMIEIRPELMPPAVNEAKVARLARLAAWHLLF